MQIIRTLFTHKKIVTLKYIHSYIYKMNKMYVRCPADSSVFDMSFQYVDSTLDLNRQFNFSRKQEESVDAFLSRVNTNLDKVISKIQKKKMISPPKSERQTNIQLLLDGKVVSGTEICKDVFTSNGILHLILYNQKYQVLINSPWVKSIALPKSFLVNFPVYPIKLETVFAKVELCDFEWFKSLDKKQWNYIGKGYVFYPRKEDIGSYIKVSCIPRNKEEFGPRAETESDCVVEASPGPCPFETRHNFTKENLTGKNFRVVSYNILADANCDSDYARTAFYPYCPPHALELDYRKQLILAELMGYNADIICLQEVDDKVFKNDLTPIFNALNFGGIFTKKHGTYREGSACLYDTKRFKLLETNSLVYAKELPQNVLFAPIWEKVSSNKKFVTRFTDLGAILQLAIFEVTGLKEILMVANTHLYFHPDADHIRLIQGGMALMFLQHVMKTLTEKHVGKRVSLIFCGDFNTVPSCGIFQLYTKGCVDSKHVDWCSNSEEQVKGVNFNNSELLASACGTPKYTNFTLKFRDCLDYIFYEPNKIKVTQVVPLLSVEELQAYVALPSVVVPSDHIALVADLQWVD